MKENKTIGRKKRTKEPQKENVGLAGREMEEGGLNRKSMRLERKWERIEEEKISYLTEL